MSYIPVDGQLMYNHKKQELRIGDGEHETKDLVVVNTKLVIGKFSLNKDKVFSSNTLFYDEENQIMYLCNGKDTLKDLKNVLRGGGIVATDEEVMAIIEEAFSDKKNSSTDPEVDDNLDVDF